MEHLASYEDQIANEMLVRSVLGARAHDFQNPAVVADPEVRTLGESSEHTFVVIPGDLRHDERCPPGQMFRGVQDLVRS